MIEFCVSAHFAWTGCFCAHVVACRVTMGRGHVLSRATCTTVNRPSKASASPKCRTGFPVKVSFGVPQAVLRARSSHALALVARATDDDDYDAEMDAMDRMEKSIGALQTELAGVRAGRAMPSMLSTVTVEYYGAPTPLQSLATVSTPDAGSLIVKPFDKSSIKAVEDAIIDAGLGFNPSNDGEMIRINVPQLTEERRKELVKVVSSEGESSKVAVRNVRRDVLKKADKLELSEDELKGVQDSVQDLTDSYVKKIDEMIAKKSKELTTV
eukprot:jgi/Ulvmu1/12247/UM086_0038.1